MKQKGFIEVVVLVVILVIAVAAGTYYLGRTANRTQPLSTVVPTSQTQPAIPRQTSTEIKVYTDPSGNYKFSYPSNWEVLDKVPDKFRARPSYVESGNIKEWLSGKMLGESCRGPVLQNTSDTSQLIVFEIVDAKGDGGYCWSVGYFMDENKWQVSKEYAYPVGSNNLRKPEWKGDYFKMESAGKSNQSMATVALVNYETFQLKGQDVLQSIISSFKFLR